MSALLPVCKHEKAYPCEFCLEDRIADLERQLAEAQAKVEEAEEKARKYDAWFEAGCCPACHFKEKHMVSCPVGILERERDGYKAQSERRRAALEGFDQHGCQASGAHPKVMLGERCGECYACIARAAIDMKPEQAKER